MPSSPNCSDRLPTNNRTPDIFSSSLPFLTSPVAAEIFNDYTMKSLLGLNKYLLRYKGRLTLGLLFCVCFNWLGIYPARFIGEAIDALNKSYTVDTLIRYAGLIVLFAASSGLFLFLVRQTIIVVSRLIEYDMKNDFYGHLQTLSLGYFKQMSTGDLMSRATNDMSNVRNYFGPGIMYSVNTLFRFVFALSAMLAISPTLTLYALIPAPILSYSVYKLGQLIHERSQKLQAKYADLTTKIQENLSGIRVVKAYTREDSEIAGFQKLNLQYYVQNLSLAKLQSFFYPLMFTLIGISITTVVWIGGYEIVHKDITVGQLAQFLIYIGMLIWPMISIGWVTNILQRAAASQERLDEILRAVPEIIDNAQTDYSITTIDGDVEFQHVSYAYKGNLNRKVLQDVSFRVPKHTRFAIVGLTGAGKSTIVNLIPRLFDPVEGHVLIDGKDARTIPIDVLRRHIGFVQQDMFLFSDSIASNIAFGVETATHAEIESAAKAASIYNDIQTFPHQFETMLGERGITLSGGQKQRACLARAIIRSPKILILDDSLSAIDTKTEDEILRYLNEQMKACTTILISHRISTVRYADHIIVVDDGRIVESGTHDLLVSQNGLYADMHRKQLLEQELSEIK
jgi:ATP-binding cassette subfamily B multidrug efflux pump